MSALDIKEPCIDKEGHHWNGPQSQGQYWCTKCGVVIFKNPLKKEKIPPPVAKKRSRSVIQEANNQCCCNTPEFTCDNCPKHGALYHFDKDGYKCKRHRLGLELP